MWLDGDVGGGLASASSLSAPSAGLPLPAAFYSHCHMLLMLQKVAAHHTCYVAMLGCDTLVSGHVMATSWSAGQAVALQLPAASCMQEHSLR
jgi:hypothetical protein